MQKSSIKKIKTNASDLQVRAHMQWKNGALGSAFRLLLAAAKLGDAYAQHTLGYFYDVGLGVKHNRAAAMHWYGLAYRKGTSGSANNIGTIFRDSGDTKRALAWFRRAVELGEIDANLEIAKILLQDPARVTEARSYLECVAHADPKKGVTTTYRSEAIKLLKKSARVRQQSFPHASRYSVERGLQR